MPRTPTYFLIYDIYVGRYILYRLLIKIHIIVDYNIKYPIHREVNPNNNISIFQKVKYFRDIFGLRSNNITDLYENIFYRFMSGPNMRPLMHYYCYIGFWKCLKIFLSKKIVRRRTFSTT